MAACLYEEVPAEEVPLAQRVAADIAKKYAQADLGIRFQIRWFRRVAEKEARLDDMLDDLWKRNHKILNLPPLASAPKRFEQAAGLLGQAGGLTETTWISGDQKPRQVASTILHEAKHLEQFESGFAPRIAGYDTLAKRYAVESDADAYERRAAALLTPLLEEALAEVR